LRQRLLRGRRDLLRERERGRPDVRDSGARHVPSRHEQLLMSLSISARDVWTMESGQILDVDGQEGWTVDARNANGVSIDQVTINAGASGTCDGIATPFSFKHATADIASIRIKYTGGNTTAELAWDNFSQACTAK
jgi:hypothetical protein